MEVGIPGVTSVDSKAAGGKKAAGDEEGFSRRKDRILLRNQKSPQNPCEGHVEYYHSNEPGYVGDKTWNENIEKVICKSTHCGVTKNSTVDVDIPVGSKIWRSELKCKGDEKTLMDCHEIAGLGISTYGKSSVKKVTCSHKIKISLDKHECAGAVTYTIDEKETGYFCNDNWERDKAELLCKSCGGVEAIPNPEMMITNKFTRSPKMKLNCNGITVVDHLWQCVTDRTSDCKPATVTCKDYERLQLNGSSSNVCSGELQKQNGGKWEPVNSDKTSPDKRCKQMNCGDSGNYTEGWLMCKDKVKVELLNSAKAKCFGRVNINRNGNVSPVCASRWNENEGTVVCRELGCGELITFQKFNSRDTGSMDHISCSGTESSLWHCEARHGEPIDCSTTVDIDCSDSINVKLSDGLGKCSGRLEIQYQGKWSRISREGWNEKYADMVCKHLGCGERGYTKSKSFAQGSGPWLKLKCKDSALEIPHCFRETSEKSYLNANENDPVEITCEDHKEVFLNGTCRGEVGIVHGNKTYWLSGSSHTWDQESAKLVCKQMHCGNLTNYNISNTNRMDVWGKSLSCSSTSNSLFNCTEKALPSDHNNAIASVECSGNIAISLSHTCWGKVQMYSESGDGSQESGGVCKDAWTPEKSEMLCETLVCGKRVFEVNEELLSKSNSKEKIFAKSLHTTNHTTDLSQCNYVKNKDNNYMCDLAYVVCSGSVKPKFSISRDKCSGNVEVFYQDNWLPVAEEALKNKATQNIICGELGCGTAVELLAFFGPAGSDFHISKLNCPSNDNNSLAECDVAVKKSSGEKLGGLRCSNWMTMALEGNGGCHGKVVVYSMDEQQKNLQKYHVSSENWTDTERLRLCQDMDCKGNGRSEPGQAIEENKPFNTTFRCEGDKQNIWSCNTKTPPSHNDGLTIDCSDKLTTPQIGLEDNGIVKINNVEICASLWKADWAHKACQELNRGDSVDSLSATASPSEKYYVMCERHHYFLSQCKRIKGECDSQLYIFCTNDVKFRTTEHLGGALQVNYRNAWEDVYTEQPLQGTVELKVCELLEKGNASMGETKADQTGGKVAVLRCSKDHVDVKRCLKIGDKGRNNQARIECEGYVAPTPPPTLGPPTEPLPVPIIVLVVFLVVLVIAAVVFFIVRRGRKFGIIAKFLPSKVVEFESGEYEDVEKTNEMEDFSRTRIKSDTEFVTENDAHSTSSLPYDDVDEATELQPLTATGTMAAASRNDDGHEDKVAYEVDDPQESYDDVDACPEITETQAEVHGSPPSTVESNELVQNDEDYVVPDETG
ncbi:scavenger receptor cysteine-rich type 1 protein M130 [Pholidichthys leucotaenia]